MKRKPRLTKSERQAAADVARGQRIAALPAAKREVALKQLDVLSSQRCPPVARIPASAIYGNRFERGGWVLRLGVALHQFAISRRCLNAVA